MPCAWRRVCRGQSAQTKPFGKGSFQGHISSKCAPPTVQYSKQELRVKDISSSLDQANAQTTERDIAFFDFLVDLNGRPNRHRRNRILDVSANVAASGAASGAADKSKRHAPVLGLLLAVDDRVRFSHCRQTRGSRSIAHRDLQNHSCAARHQLRRLASQHQVEFAFLVAQSGFDDALPDLESSLRAGGHVAQATDQLVQRGGVARLHAELVFAALAASESHRLDHEHENVEQRAVGVANLLQQRVVVDSKEKEARVV